VRARVWVLGGPSETPISTVDLDELFAGVPELPADEYSEFATNNRAVTRWC
jgi:hypothetical protein